MTPLLFNVMMLALVALLILNWIDSEPKKAVAIVVYSPKTRA